MAKKDIFKVIIDDALNIDWLHNHGRLSKIKDKKKREEESKKLEAIKLKGYTITAKDLGIKEE